MSYFTQNSKSDESSLMFHNYRLPNIFCWRDDLSFQKKSSTFIMLPLRGLYEFSTLLLQREFNMNTLQCK